MMKAVSDDQHDPKAAAIARANVGFFYLKRSRAWRKGELCHRRCDPGGVGPRDRRVEEFQVKRGL
jgi:hypothetical protein